MFRYFFRKKMLMNTPPRIPRVMTRAMVTKEPVLIKSTLRPGIPMLWAAISATLSSYCRAPMTESLSHEKGTPKVPERATTPRRILMDGSSVNVALDVMVFLRTFL